MSMCVKTRDLILVGAGTVQTPSQSVPPSHFNNFNNLQPKQTVPADLFGTNQNGANPLKTKQWDGGTLRKGISTVPREVGVADGPDGPEGCLADDWAKKKPHTCVQCHGPPDGKEEMCSFGIIFGLIAEPLFGRLA